MCLESVSKKVERQYGKSEVGWKVFLLRGDELRGEYCGIKVRELDEWLKEEGYRELDEDNNETIPYGHGNSRYKRGWHVFLTEEGAKDWRGHGRTEVIRKVHFRNPVAWGYQLGHPVLVCKEIFIPKEGK
jgi:hypothetical protein